MTTTDTSPTDLSAPGSPLTPVVRADAPADLITTFRRNWKLVLVPALMAMLIAWIMAAVQPKRYRATAVAAVAPVQAGLAAYDLLRGVEVLDRRSVISTIAALATTPVTTKQAVGSLRGNYNIDTAVMPNTNLFSISVEGPDPTGTMTIANRVPVLLASQTAAMFKVYSVSTVSAATIPTQPFAPRVGRAIVAGFMIGLLIGAALTYLLHALRTRAR